jgi:hypothetical protein
MLAPVGRFDLIAKISVLVVAIAVPAAAQTPAATPPTLARAGLVGSSAFAPLVQGKAPTASGGAASRANSADDLSLGLSRPDGSRSSLLKQVHTIASRQARAVTSVAPPPRRKLANWQKQVLFWGGVVGGLILLGVWSVAAE